MRNTPKEDALDMFIKYKNSESHKVFTEKAKNIYAKECSLICVRKILYALSKDHDWKSTTLNHWFGVQKELEQL